MAKKKTQSRKPATRPAPPALCIWTVKFADGTEREVRAHHADVLHGTLIFELCRADDSQELDLAGAFNQNVWAEVRLTPENDAVIDDLGGRDGRADAQ
jgi:hypothetical protein